MSEDGTTEEYSPSEEKARKGGWVPQDEWRGNTDEWVDYKEFNYRGELMERIKKQTREIDALKNSMQELSKIKEQAINTQKESYERVIRDLKEQKAQAYREEDFDKVAEIDDAIIDAKEKRKEIDIEAEESQGEHPALAEWKDANEWYDVNDEMTKYADRIGIRYAKNNPGVTMEEVLEHVDEKIKEKFLEKEEKRSSSKVNESELSGPTNKGRKKWSFGDLSADQQKFCRKFESLGVMTEKDYIQSLVNSGELS